MTSQDFAAIATQHSLGDDPIQEVVLRITAGCPAELVWRNELGGLTFRIDETSAKWNPRRTGVDLGLERSRLEWLAGRHPAPRVASYGADAEAQWLVTAAVPGGSAVGATWRARRPAAIRAIAGPPRSTPSW